ncbi:MULTISPECIES: TetR/AcrR family transcriptional regulator [Microbacterium]|uniref:TetR/AcrR family transcriptional regulator n=1 Tax=Microbacterium wangchenii TaxID=2541726 RepID=A0ABX5SRV3_9MICO|nr:MULTISPECIES: TetR/AcrR family transcriptional regulator [Microbacterium]MCK6068299.1 TetR/AcrR family transcriptional regulator [Microbacterium sp. EYE_512]QBR87579.1 TetR/AcrR family transcriptional regulator [Microbacterium wangchenii]TFV84340.1 TetR/AcrR family transcriptional regulator [Microbacterium sp. dk485]TXK15847.1 TetR/AcrR family transcriptional regulator [Microbacterium wangchenii]
MSAARDRWLDEGLRVLAEEGAAGLRIDRVAARIGLSKGSFHHHFDGAEAYKRAVLECFEHLCIDALDDAIAGQGDSDADAGPREILARLTALIQPHDAGLYRPQLEVAVRAWATTDAEARTVQARVDEARVRALQSVWRPLVHSDAQAHAAALLPYLVAVGGAMAMPPVGAEELQGVFELLLPLVPDAPGPAPQG